MNILTQSISMNKQHVESAEHVHDVSHGVSISHLRHDYNGFTALDDVSLEVPAGMFLALLGKNGSGKTTLAKHLNGLLQPTSGMVTVDGLNTSNCPLGLLAQHVGFVFQNPDDQIFCSSVRQELTFGPKAIGYTQEWADQLAEKYMKRFGLEELADVSPATLGYGDRRKVALASVLAMDTKTIVLDEPTAGLDRGLSNRLLDELAVLNHQGITIVIISHDMRVVARYCSHAAVLNDGHLLGFGTVREVLTNTELLTKANCLAPLTVEASLHMGVDSRESALTPNELARRFMPLDISSHTPANHGGYANRNSNFARAHNSVNIADATNSHGSADIMADTDTSTDNDNRLKLLHTEE